MINKSMRRYRAMRRRNLMRKIAIKTICLIGATTCVYSMYRVREKIDDVQQNEFIKVSIEETTNDEFIDVQIEESIEVEPLEEVIQPQQDKTVVYGPYTIHMQTEYKESPDESETERTENIIEEDTHKEEDGWYIMEQYGDYTLYGYKNPDNSLHANIDNNKDNDKENSSFGNAREDVTTNRPTKSNVYYTEGGKSYHSRKSCPTLKRSNVKYGTCDKTDPCNVCCR